APGFPEATWLLLPSPVMAAMRGPTSRRRDAGSRSGGALGVPVRGLGASVLLFEQRERERRAVRARLDVERRLQGEVGRGGPLAARGARLPGVEREVQQLLGLQADVVRGLRVRTPIEAGRHLLAGSDLPAAVGDEARGPAQVVGGDRVLPVGAHEVARLP